LDQKLYNVLFQTEGGFGPERLMRIFYFGIFGVVIAGAAEENLPRMIIQHYYSGTQSSNTHSAQPAKICVQIHLE
jgi:hypothetical protein